MKYIHTVKTLIPLIIVTISLVQYNVELNSYIAQNTNSISTQERKQKVKTTEVHIVGTVHFETDLIKREYLFALLDSISPSIILYEGDSSTVRSITNKTDYLARLLDVFKRKKRVEKPVVLKYLKNNPNSILLPYEWELKVQYQRKHKLRKNSKKLINDTIGLFSDKLLNENESATIEKFLELNKALVKIEKNATISTINSVATDSILKYRQHYIYKDIPEIALQRKELDKYSDFVPIHMNYWETRNKAMVQNILKQIKANPNTVIVVLNGFYHRYYLIEELKKYEHEFEFQLKGV